MADTVVITGANRGIGLELARQFTAHGATVVGGCRTPDEATELAALDPAAIVQVDVGDEESVSAFAAGVADAVDHVDVLVNNAGIGVSALGLDRRDAGWRSVPVDATLDAIRINGLGAVMVTRSILPLLEAAGGARVVNITSQIGSMVVGARFRDLPYAASKAVMNMFTVQAAAELADEQVTVVCMHPGWVQTDMGGAQADLTVAEAAGGIIEVVGSLGPEDSGRFLRWDGTEHSW